MHLFSPCRIPKRCTDGPPSTLLAQLNIANPATGCQKKVEITDESKL